MSNIDYNSQSEIYKRLIKAFSVNAIKEIFNLDEYKEKQSALIERIVETNSTDIISNSLFENFSLLKQHVYLYDFLGVFPLDWLSKHPYLYSTQTVTSSHIIYNLLYPISFEFFNKTKNELQSLKFLIPVQIHKKGLKLIIHINILERDIASIIEDKIVSTTRDNNDDTILNSVIESMPHTVRLTKADLNKGIKKLWEDDEVDAFKVKFKKAKSTSMEVMDEDKLLKRDMPEVYNELIKTPLIQNTFRVLKQKNLINYFVVDPTKGIFYFSVYPQNQAGIYDLIDLVLKHN